MSKAVQIGDVCKYGHLIAGDNAAYRTVRGRNVIRCAKCLADVAKRYNSTDKGKAANAAKERKRRRTPGHSKKQNAYARLYRARKAEEQAAPLGEADLAKYDEKKTAVQKVLGVRPEAAESWAAMNAYLDEHRTPCLDRPDLYSDYDDPRYPEDSVGVPFPTTAQAENLCVGCPLAGSKGLCLTFALQNKEDSGVWGGKRVIAGRVYTGGSGRITNNKED